MAPLSAVGSQRQVSVGPELTSFSFHFNSARDWSLWAGAPTLTVITSSQLNLFRKAFMGMLRDVFLSWF